MITQEHIIQNSSGTYSRRVWLLDAAGENTTRMAIFLDGEFYVNRMDAPATIHELQENGTLPPMPCLFVSHVDGAARHQDLTCNPAYAEFITRDVVPWMKERYPQLADHDHVIAGPSLGGLTSAFVTLNYPQIFSRCLSQSGSFWWNDEWLTANLNGIQASPSMFWLSVGDKETTAGVSHPPTGMRQEVAQMPACERFAVALTRQHHSVFYRLYDGGHELQPWADELPAALKWLIK